MGIADELKVKRFVTEEEVHDALETLRRTARPLGEARGRAMAAEARLRHVKAIEMKFSRVHGTSAQEREAYASPRYVEAIEEMERAVAKHEMLKAERETASIVIEMFRTQEATLRASARL